MYDVFATNLVTAKISLCEKDTNASDLFLFAKLTKSRLTKSSREE